MPGVSIRVAVSAGELIDRITILEIKSERFDDAAKLENVRTELEALTAARRSALPPSAGLSRLSADLKAVNQRLWQIEDDIRACEAAQDFGPRFVELARAVYFANDERSRLKRQINELTGSAIVEEKSYTTY